MIPQDFIQTLLNRVDIADVVERYVPLKRAGSELKACCPFHHEKTPSFYVVPQKQFYHCFGCGAHGTAVSFLMEYAGLGYVEALKELAAGVGMNLPEQPRSSRPVPGEANQGRPQFGPDELTGAMQRALHFYRQCLKTAPDAIAYLKGRGVSGEIAARFGIGYAPPGWRNLEAAFPDYAAEVLVEAGLVIRNEDGTRHDRFRDRILFPILDVRGAVIGFGGRVMGQGEPKYLNSPETPLFEKGCELYGLYQARRAIRDTRTVLVVEGYMDAVALAQHGVENVVATLGTATTAVHVQKLLRQADNLVFCFDGDTAGRNAAWRALEVSLPLVSDGKNVSFLLLPAGEDPDSFVRSAGKEGFGVLLGQARPLSAFLLGELAGRADLKSEEGRARLLQLAKPLVTQIAAPMLSLMLRKRLAELAGLGREELDALFQIKSVRGSMPPARMPRSSPVLERKLISHLLCQPRFAESFDVVLPESANGDSSALRELVVAIRSLPGPVAQGLILERFRGTPFESTIGQGMRDALALEASLSEEELLAEFKDALSQLRHKQLKQQIDAFGEKERREGLSAEERLAYGELFRRLGEGRKQAREWSGL